MKKTLIITDIQNDFCPGGSLEVADGNKIISYVNNLTLNENYDFLIFTKDWHPSNHKSFASQHSGKNVFDKIDLYGIEQILWPDHCIQNTFGSEFHPDLNTEISNKFVFTKGMNENIDSYSAFFDNKRDSSTGLHEFLFEKNVKSIDIVGLALDYCVKFTALDAAGLGYDVNIILDGCKAISLDITTHLDEMRRHNIRII